MHPTVAAATAALLAMSATACTSEPAPVAEVSWTISASSSIQGCGGSRVGEEVLSAVRLELHHDWPRPMRESWISCADGLDLVEPYVEATEICYVAATPSTGYYGCDVEDFLGIPCEPGTYSTYRTLGPMECFDPAALRGAAPLQVRLQVY